MKSSAIRILMLLLAAFFLFGCGIKPQDKPVNDFSLYLVKNLTTVEARKQSLQDLPLESSPILTDRDIETYNWKEHVFTIKEGSKLEETLAGQVPTSGRPFVAVVDGERIYLGSFWSYLSSLYNPEIPTISSTWLKGTKKDTYTISYSGEQDPRRDSRIYQTLKEQGKLEE